MRYTCDDCKNEHSTENMACICVHCRYEIMERYALAMSEKDAMIATLTRLSALPGEGLSEEERDLLRPGKAVLVDAHNVRTLLALCRRLLPSASVEKKARKCYCNDEHICERSI